MNLRFWLALLLIVAPLSAPAAEIARPIASLLESRCFHCHNSDDAHGDVDLEELLQSPDPQTESELWIKVEAMVAAAKMPPQDEEPLTAAQRETVVDWFRQTFILRDGHEHIGLTPLRRLTRYELENTLEDLLHIKLKQPYEYSIQTSAFQPSTIQRLYPADTPGESGFDNDALRMQQVKVPLVKYIECLDYALRVFDESQQAREAVLGFSDTMQPVDRAMAEKILMQFAGRASRGYVNDEDRRLILAAWENAGASSTSYEAIRRALHQALLSPTFLFRLENSRGAALAYPVSAQELAVRLSYFLWSSMPDEELFAVADDDSLLREEVFRRQLTRMLNSPRRIALSENFAGQWLGFAALRSDPMYFRNEAWNRGVYDELLFSFDELIRSDRSILELVDAEWVYLRSQRQRQAPQKIQLEAKYEDIFALRRSNQQMRVERFYHPPELRRVQSDRLGGMLTSSGIMRLTSAPESTKPITRGVWLLETIIGEKMHPPANVPPLSESEQKTDSQKADGIVEALKLHTAKAACRSCHQHIDPLGLGLENFSPTGDWRTKYPDKSPIISQGTLPNGKTFTTPKQLKQELVTFYRDQIVDNTIRQMLSYALGRKLQPYDRPTIERIHEALAANDYRMTVLIEEIALSQPFRYRQDQ